MMLGAVYLEFFKNLGLFIVAPILVCTFLWSQLKVRPTQRVVMGVGCWITCWVGWQVTSFVEVGWWSSISPIFQYICQYGLFFFAALVLLDFVILLLLPDPRTERKAPTRFASGVSTEIEVKISNPSAFPMKVNFHDGLPMEAICEALPWSDRLPSRGYIKVTYPLELIERGDTMIEQSYVEYQTLLGMWSRQIRTGEEQEVKVYPNYEPIVRYALLTMESTPEQMGIVMKNRVGMSKEFHQLRDYQLDDAFQSI